MNNLTGGELLSNEARRALQVIEPLEGCVWVDLRTILKRVIIGLSMLGSK